MPMRTAISACLLAFTCVNATAANLQISPVSITFRAGQGASAITLQNQGDAPVYGQVRAYAWSQANGEDVLAETADLVASPPIIEIGPRATQMIRLILKSGTAQPAERSFRLLIDEVPRGDSTESGVNIRLRYSVPVFVMPAGDPQPVLAWRILRQEGKWMLRVANSGTLHAQVGATSLRDAAGTEIDITKGLLGYVLAGQERTWALPVASDARLDGKVTVQSIVNARTLSAPVAGQ